MQRPSGEKIGAIELVQRVRRGMSRGPCSSSQSLVPFPSSQTARIFPSGANERESDRGIAELQRRQRIAGRDVPELDATGEAARREHRAVRREGQAEQIGGRHFDLRAADDPASSPGSIGNWTIRRLSGSKREPCGGHELAIGQRSRSPGAIYRGVGASAIMSMARTCRPVSASQKRTSPSFWAVTAAVPSRVKSIPATPVV